MEKQKRPIYSNVIIKSDETDENNELQQQGIRLCQQIAVAGAFLGPFQPLTIPKRILRVRPESSYDVRTAQKWLKLVGMDGKEHRFPLQTFLPKVQLDRFVPPKQLPRDVEVDRRRRQYQKMNVSIMLDEMGLTPEELLPTEEQYYLHSESVFKHFLPLSFFDDTDFDVHSPEAWLKLGFVVDEQYQLPAKAFVPDLQKNYSWKFVGVHSFNNTTGRWNVMVLSDEQYYDIPKIQLMFLAESPYMFVQRIQNALEARNTAEKCIMVEAIVDCVLLQDLKDNRVYPSKIVDKLEKNFKGDKHFFKELRLEVYLVFEHLMACYEFEKFVKLLPREFPSLGGNLIRNSLPRAVLSPQSAIERNKLKALKLNMKDTRYNVLKATLFYIPAGIEAMHNVAVECAYIETLTIFVSSFNKAIPLNDFLHSQQQHSNNVAGYLKIYWPQKISSGIYLVLRPLGRGWLDITLNNWSVYQMCKISRFILQTRFRMQESMQVLLEKSIESFSRFLSKPCEQFLHLQPDFKWTSNFIDTEFPYPKPIFSLNISVSDDHRVFYSTAPEEFQPALLEIFKKGLEKSSGVRWIDAETLTNLRFAHNLYILTVELIEPLYLQWDEILRDCYLQAVIPLHAYAKLYERFIKFYLTNVSEYIRDYEAANHSSLEVKQDILEHKRQKDELRAILPATIVIGPFLVNVDIMKQSMIKKHIDIVKRLFEYYVQRMYDINEKLGDQCHGIYTKIAERPQSIEHLYDIRDFAVTVPEQVEQLKGDIQIMWLEYEMLDSFFYNLSDHQFSMKWEVYAWPHKIMQRLTNLREEQKSDIDEFMRMHLSECIGFEERLESLNDEIQAFSLQFDALKVMEIAVDVKKTWKIITDLQRQGDLLKYRHTLFGLDEYSIEFLDSIIRSFTPYRNLWSTCADFVKLEEATIGNPMVNVELEDVWNSIEDIRASLNDSYEVFSEKEEIQNVASTFLDKLTEFLPVYNGIKWLKNEHWLFLHWQELALRSGMELKYSVAMNFQYCIRKGIMDHLDLVHEISEKAEVEADAIQKALEEEERLREEARVALLERKAMRKCRTDIL